MIITIITTSFLVLFCLCNLNLSVDSEKYSLMTSLLKINSLIRKVIAFDQLNMLARTTRDSNKITLVALVADIVISYNR